MNKFLSCIISFLFIYFFIKCTKETETEASNEIIVPNIIKTESQIRDEVYKADEALAECINSYQSLKVAILNQELLTKEVA